MLNLRSLSDVQVVLLAAQYISEVDVQGLQAIAAERKDVLTRDLIYRLLLTLYPTDETARSALIALLRNVNDDFYNTAPLDHAINIADILNLPPNIIAKQAENLHLYQIPDQSKIDQEISLEDFLIAWICRVESNENTLEHASTLIDVFSTQYPLLRLWANTYLEPVLRLQYEYYPDVQNVLGVQQLMSLTGITGIRALLQYAEQSEQKSVARDLDTVVTPWITGITRYRELQKQDHRLGEGATSWADVNEWILSTSLANFKLATKAILEWEGPFTYDVQNSDLPNEVFSTTKYAQTAFAVMFANLETSNEVSELSKNVLRKVCTRMDVSLPDITTSQPDISQCLDSLDEITGADLWRNALLLPENRLTVVTTATAAFVAGVLLTLDLLGSFKIDLNMSDITKICLFGPEERQKHELIRLVQQVRQVTNVVWDWRSVRTQILWLQSWRSASSEDKNPSHSKTPAYLGRLQVEFVETEILNAILASDQLDVATEIYAQSAVKPLSMHQVEQLIVSAIYSAYDNASNGNRTRGEMKRAYNLYVAFRPYYMDSENMKSIDYLIKATHNLSFYPLTLQPGVPFRPVNIRVHKDPLSLIGNVLDQDPKAYTKLDDLLGIGRNLVLAKLPHTTTSSQDFEDENIRILKAQNTIVYLAIKAALAAHDFDTAYSYITTRLSSSSSPSGSEVIDNTSWQAAYAAGKYRPQHSPSSLHVQIANLSKRMDLLSTALTLAPNPEPLAEILGTWRRCEEEMDQLKAQALSEERAFERQEPSEIPGGFGLDDREMDVDETRQAMVKRASAGHASSYEEQAPMGLFDVARGAANALRKSTAIKPPPVTTPTEEAFGRVRKRDMVSNMVTGGLVSGMSWVLGAQPVERNPQNGDE